MGLKPSRGRNPSGPDLGEGWYGQVQDGVVSRSVRDTAAVLDATAGGDAGMPYSAPPPQPPQPAPPAEEPKPFTRGVKRPGVSRFISGRRR